MKLDVCNFAKIRTANIELNGITVIAGNNNTGKTTVGKILFSIFNSIYDINGKIEDSRSREIYSRCRHSIRNVYLSNGIRKEDGAITRSSMNRRVEVASRDFSRLLQNKQEFINDANYVVELFTEVSEKNGLPINDEIKENFRQIINQEIDIVNNTEDYRIALEIIERFFNNIFSNQVCNLTNSDSSKIKLNIHEQEIEFLFNDNRCVEWNNSIEIMHEAFLVDDPFLIDELGDIWGGFSYGGQATRDFLLRKIEASAYDEQENVISSVLAKEKLKEIEQIINNIVPEEVQRKNGEWVVASDSYRESIHVDNLSAGVKSFLLLKMLLERGILKEKDVLILDEPEIHLHPEWQIKYAEIIVLLQKKFDLSILVTTHSRDFFEAIELYSKKYCIMDKCKFYLSKPIDNEVEFADVSDQISEIYKHLVDPSKLLDKIKFELEDE